MSTAGDYSMSHDVVFKSKVILANGVDAPDCIITPDRKGNFCIWVVNMTVEDVELNQGIVLGTVEPIQNLGGQDVYATLDPSQMSSRQAIWHMASLIYDEERETDGLETLYVSCPLLVEEKGLLEKNLRGKCCEYPHR